VKTPGRAVAVGAVGFLLLDAILLVWLGLDLHRGGFLAGGISCAAAAVGVIVLWRRYRRMLAEVEAGRREMKAEAESLRDLLKTHHLEN
jgi:uncharacterized membrane protein YccC